ncbi:MAG: baseplate J/gp47 family protein [Ktedonobacteraceae bacterium]
MYQVDDEPMETIHLYVVREGQERPSLLPVFISLIALSLLLAIGILTSYQQPEQRASIRVPAVLLPLTSFTTSVIVLPTGIKTYPATTAQGVLTVTNGSILSEELPKGMILTGKDGVAVVTDAAVFVPAGSAAGYGVASVSAHAATSGTSGNIPTLDIDSVEGTALYLRNLHPFTGGAASSTMKFITSQDRQNALAQARMALLRQTLSGLLSHPCLERVVGTTSLHVAWTCQFVTYTVPALPHVRMQQVQVIGRTVFLTITYLPRPQHLETK